jgi:hypothetical protein
VLNRESNESAMTECNEVLEVDLLEAKFCGVDLTFSFSNLENLLLGTLSNIVSPETD